METCTRQTKKYFKIISFQNLGLKLTTDNYPVTLNKTLIKDLGFVEVCPSL